MNLSNKHIFIILNDNTYGLIKLSINKDLENLELKVEYFRIISTDSKVLENIYSMCINNSTNKNLLKTCSNELVNSKIFNLKECEDLCDSLEFINNKEKKHDEYMQVKLYKELQIPISLYNIKSIYNFVYSFYTNYNILESMMRLNLLTARSNEVEQKSQKQRIINEHEQIEIKEHKIDDKLENIFNLIFDNSIKTSLINNIFNNYNQISNIKFENNQLIFSNIIINSYGINCDYIKSLIISNNNHSNQISHNLLKLYQMILDKQYNTNSFYLNMILYLIFIYTICNFMKTNPDYTMSRLDEILINLNLQANIMNRLLETNEIFLVFKEKIKFCYQKNKITEDKIDFIHEEKLKEISEKYHHLKPISQEEFINSILNDYNNIKTKDSSPLILSKKKTININNFLNSSQTNDLPNLFVNVGEQEDLENLSFNLLEYQVISNRIITKSYHYILKYIKDPSIILSVKNIPKTVVNLFDLLTKNVLNNGTIQKDNISTLNFYNILKEKIPHINKFDHITILFIIFQIMIPFSYDMYKNEIFEDSLLV